MSAMTHGDRGQERGRALESGAGMVAMLRLRLSSRTCSSLHTARLVRFSGGMHFLSTRDYIGAGLSIQAVSPLQKGSQRKLHDRNM